MLGRACAPLNLCGGLWHAAQQGPCLARPGRTRARRQQQQQQRQEQKPVVQQRQVVAAAVAVAVIVIVIVGALSVSAAETGAVTAFVGIVAVVVAALSVPAAETGAGLGGRGEASGRSPLAAGQGPRPWPGILL